MADFRTCSIEYFPDNLLIEILSYMSVRELVRAGRVCKRWRNLVREQRLWQSVDLSKTKGMTSRVLWFLLRQYLGRGLRCLRLRGLLLSARGGAFLSESWLQGLSSRCPQLRILSLLHADLRGLHSCLLLPLTLQVLELRGCELPPGFFSQSSSSTGGTKRGNRVGRVSLATTLAGSQTGNGPANTFHKGIAIETLVLDNVPSFTDLHLQSLSSWERLNRLEMRDVIRITAAGLRNCAIRDGGREASGGLSKLTALELGNSGRPGSQTQMASLGLGEGWAGLQELTLGGREVGPGLLCVSRLHDLRHLRLRSCRLSQVQVLRSCRGLHSLRGMEFCEVVFPGHQQNCDGEEEEHGNDEGSDEEGDPVPTLRRALASLLPQCTLQFTRCSVTLSAD
uniref:F-box and leucine rich repeat protein 12 n=1 Tax=Paramormyrops kingsleyae TaxID=1676925 RepID=A0A3B3REJ8_9TELE|nr:F-box/LRR-repeat protein 12 [Paramormyrops kingsleyae]